MASEVEVCNLALSNIRGGSINSLNEPSIQAQICKLKYPLMRDFLLTDFPWQFANGLKPLTLLTTELFNWAFAWQYPADCQQINRLVGSFEELGTDSGTAVISQSRQRLLDSQLRTIDELRRQIPYEIFNVDGNRVIGTNEPDLRIDYRIEITDPNLFSPAFIIALSYLLAAEVAIPIIGAEMGRTLRSDSIALYRAYLASGMANDMNEQYHPPGDSEFVNIRR